MKGAEMKKTRAEKTRILPAGSSSRRTSLQDVAKSAGVSAAAVSYVVNGRTKEVSAKTLEKIELAIRTLKYKPQRRGLSLKLNREFAIGLVIVDPNPSFLADPFTTEVAAGLSNALVEPGYGLTVAGCKSLDDLQRLMQRPIGVDAFVVLASGPREERERCYRTVSDNNMPLVIVQEAVPASVPDACSISQDDFGGARELTRHLLGCGTRRFLFVAPSCAWPAIERRESGIRSTLTEECSFVRIDCDEGNFDDIVALVDRHLGHNVLPDVIMGANDQIAMAALRALDRRGIVVPREVQVTGYNDFPFRNFIHPLLTTVKSAANRIGRSCAEVVLARLDAGYFTDGRIEYDVALDVGSTTAVLRADPLDLIAPTPISRSYSPG